MTHTHMPISDLRCPHCARLQDLCICSMSQAQAFNTLMDNEYEHADVLEEGANTSYTGNIWVGLRNALIIELIIGVGLLAAVMYFVEAK
jgi:hypothetical protein